MKSDPPMNAADLFAAIVEHSAVAIIAKDLDGTVRAWNHAAEETFGWTAEEMIGQSIRRLIPDDRQDEEDQILGAIGRGERAALRETVRLRKDGSRVHISVQVSPIRDKAGTIVGASKIARDITEELLTNRALHEAETRFGVLADNIAQLAWIADSKGVISWFNRRFFDFTGLSYETMRGPDRGENVVHPEHRDRVAAYYDASIAAGEEFEDTFPMRGADGTYRWFLTRVVPVRGPDGAVTQWFGTNTDITELRDAERRIELLLMEVNHRSKNLLSVVQSMARRTASSGEDFIPRLEQRIAALAANQDVLVQRNWSPVPLRELIDAQLSVIEQAKAQTEVIGPDVVIQSKTAEAMSMALHELAHNAEKYGAYSVPQGRVVIGWQIVGEERDAEFVLEWAESGGPAVAAPGEPGFGTRIIRDVPKARLGGEVAVDYAQTGFRFTLHCPAANVLAQPD
ncbi:MAG: PAS domain S-box protein [Novosphingobium sp.]